MGLRFRKSITIAPGIRVNLGLNGASLSLGPRGASVSVSSRGVYGNVGLPGTGFSYRTRLDKKSTATKRQSSTAQPSTIAPTEIHLEVTETGVIEAFNENGVRLPPRYVKDVEQNDPDDFRAFLVQQRDQINELTRALNDLVLMIPEPKYRPTAIYRPFSKQAPEKQANPIIVPELPAEPERAEFSWIDNTISFFHTRKTQQQERDQTAYEQAFEDYRRLQEQYRSEQARIDQSYQEAMTRYQTEQRAHEGETQSLQQRREQLLREDTNVMYEVFEDAVQEINWPRETLIAFNFSDCGKQLYIDVDLPEIEDFPAREASIDSSRLRIKKLSATQQRSLYAHHIGSIGLLLCGVGFNRLPSVRQIVISGFSQRKDSRTGHTNEDYLYSGKMTRRVFSQINFAQLGELDPMKALGLGELRCTLSKTNLFKSIEPF
ncbi:DUF4236 domain-containing protein [Endozoicomonas ascidiicola]|uniref:DUF4236 domain-containing protein n=1 Tax=Endozoicomonas ascidiicola TaxID=1698521 RepID=UPI00082B1AF2|nr:DUF4236 domain-containing protein [Endozoicomonas ascidiicola]USN27005.1 DUF4236 domain-containing protein [synthetic construct]